MMGEERVSGSVCLTVVGTDSKGDGCLTVTKIDSVVGPLWLVRRLWRMVVDNDVTGVNELSAVREYLTVFPDFEFERADEDKDDSLDPKAFKICCELRLSCTLILVLFMSERSMLEACSFTFALSEVRRAEEEKVCFKLSR